MKKLLLSLITLSLISCSKKDDFKDFGIQNKEIQTKTNGFVNTPTDSQSKVWTIIDNRWAIYGFYSSHMHKHMYSDIPLPSEIPHTQPGQYYYFLERTLGAADGVGNGNMITSWFNTNNEDQILTTNPGELNGQNGWKKDRDLGKSYTGNEEGSFPIYRYYRSATSSHFYTRDKNELGDGKDGFVYEGVAFYLKEPVPTEYRISDGSFYQDKSTGSIYVVMESQLRKVESVEVLKRIFDFRATGFLDYLATTIMDVNNIETIKGTRGSSISVNSVLYQDINTGIRYLSNPNDNRGNLKIIPNDKVFKRYHFNDSSIQKTQGVNNLRLEELKITY
ncbi:hypothetical protein [Pedobacter cryoconitis]|uniref:hypothetical protein n=1 Tax=Pedobacter cryoconitis TaxID=188932 RepID=UPI001613C142|nr:hypothetical protein [Pedobacter cryoconitis]MBB5644605.1 hypothetical protein [Pedobacter cryoconitis]